MILIFTSIVRICHPIDANPNNGYMRRIGKSSIIDAASRFSTDNSYMMNIGNS